MSLEHPTYPAQPAAEPVSPFVPTFFTVTRRRRETHDTWTLTLEAPPGYPFAFLPGQFNMLYVPGVGEVPISISGDPARPLPVDHTIRAVGFVTRALTSLRPGDMVGLRGPFGRGWPLDAARGKDVVIVGGGIGLAPLRPLIYYILRHRDDFASVVILYGARSPRELLYRRELEQWRGRFDVEALVTVDRGDEKWRGHVGVVTTLFRQAERFFSPANTVAFICGPEIMMRFTVREFQERGVPDSNIYISMERNMKCGVGLCGHCQYGPKFICKDGPVFSYAEIGPLFEVREI